MKQNLQMRSGNSGLTVKVNLWSMETNIAGFNSERARLWIKGQVTHGDTREVKKFNDPGELISVLAKWNVAQYKQLKKVKNL